MSNFVNGGHTQIFGRAIPTGHGGLFDEDTIQLGRMGGVLRKGGDPIEARTSGVHVERIGTALVQRMFHFGQGFLIGVVDAVPHRVHGIR